MSTGHRRVSDTCNAYSLKGTMSSGAIRGVWRAYSTESAHSVLQSDSSVFERHISLLVFQPKPGVDPAGRRHRSPAFRFPIPFKSTPGFG